MKKFKLILVLLVMISCSAIAQNRNQPGTSSSSGTQTGIKQSEISNAFKDCPDLDKQLTQLFGAGYTIEDPKVKEQLQKNIADKKQSRYVRKSSLKAIYGTDYINKLHLIDNNN